MIILDKHNKIDIVSFTITRINALITDEIRDEISKVYETSNARVIINLKGVDYVDSSGFSCFLSILRIAKNNYGELKFANPEPAVHELFKTLHLNTIFQIFDDLDSCLASFR